ncbi:flagellar biosynthetic protein FliO [Salinispira pacifica]|uniref:Flagellar biosynthesis protein FliZ n=1 Tax=Salinispira pacifica TaxID=1307761 RepID=V5WG55_9SPIO|nr:flagellar biosynthetic protein FliO [Salinispira pacifica]AHC14595.1 Flagellar biosynthesis protein FliZ [Salinispira pacifica]
MCTAAAGFAQQDTGNEGTGAAVEVPGRVDGRNSSSSDNRASAGEQANTNAGNQAGESAGAESRSTQQNSAEQTDAEISNQNSSNSAERSVDERSLTFDFDDVSPEEEAGSEDLAVFGFWDLLRMVLVLALVVGLIYGLYFILRKSKSSQEENSSFIQVLSNQHLPGGKTLHVIDVGGKVYLLGAGDGGVNLITEINDKETVDEMRLQASRQQLHKGNFSQLLGSFFNTSASAQGVSTASPATQPSNDGGGGDGFDFVRRQRERLKKL